MVSKRLSKTWVRTIAAVLSTAGLTSALGGTVAQLAPEQVLGYADTIFEGVVESARPYYLHGDHGPILTEYTVRVLREIRDESGELARRTGGVRGVKGQDSAVGKRVSLTFSGGRMGDVEDLVRGVPKFDPAERAFFFINKRDWNATSPLVGVHQGLYKVVQSQGREQVVRAGGCCQPAERVSGHFFAKTQTAPEGFTADQFAEEISRAVDVARQNPDLSWEKPPVAPPLLEKHEQDARTLGECASGRMLGGLAARGPVAFPLPRPEDGSVIPPLVTGKNILNIDSSENVTIITPRPPVANRYGFFSGSPDFPVVFNIAPNMNAFAGKMEEMLSYWNAHADLFRVYQNPTNTFTYGNDRNEAGFASSATLNEQQGVNWNSGEYAVCYSRSRGGEIKESDIYYNLDPGNVWTSDYLGAAGQSLASPNCAGSCTNLATYFPSVALHETGHSFGMEHQFVTNPGAIFPSIMNYYPKNRLFDTGFLFADDALAISQQYGTLPRTNGLLKMWYHDGTMGGSSNATRWTIADNTSVQRGSNLAVGGGSRYFVVDNTGTGTIAPRFDFYLTPNFGSFDSARYMGTATSAPVGARNVARYQVNVPVPGNTPPGQYFVAIAMTVAGDQDGNDNAAWSYTKVTVTAGAPSNDSWGTAIAMDPRGGTYTGTTFGANYTFGGSCGTSGSTADVWYRITPVNTGTLELLTCGSAYDTVVELFNSGLGNLGCDDDATYGPCSGTRQSRLGRNVTAGQLYYIRVSGWNGASGDFTITARVYPANDSCVRPGLFGGPSAYVYTGVPAAGTTIGATSSGSGTNNPCPVQTFLGPVNVENKNDVWYLWTSACASPMSVTTYSNRLLQVAVYAGCYVNVINPPALLACGQPEFGTINPVASFTPLAGRSYYIRVITYDVDADFSLLVTQSAAGNDVCAGFFGDPSPVIDVASGGGASVVSDNRCATPSNAGLMPPACGDAVEGFDGGNDLFYRLNILSTGTLQITRCNGNYLPVVALYSTCPTDVPQEAVACGFSSSPSCDPVIISYPVVAGQNLTMRVAGNAAAANGAVGVSTLFMDVIADVTVGACCQNDGSCAVTAQGDCGGAYQGADTTCDPNPCVQPTGACCQNGLCTVVSAVDCGGIAGAYLGDGLPCLGDPANPITCCVVNFNGEGGVTVQDIFDFLAAYFTGDAAADVNGSGDVTVQDIFDFLGGFFVGCV